MISWIVATHDRAVLQAHLLSTLDVGDDELVVVEDAPSIAAAYNEGTARARHRLKVYVHHDVRVRDMRLREVLLATCAPDVGMVGVIGSRDLSLPWWEGRRCGSVYDARMGLLDYGPGGACAQLDGLLLATAQDPHWDETYPGWHLYDHDICREMLGRGLTNVCLTGGHALVSHETDGPRVMAHLADWDTAVARYRRKWAADAPSLR